MNQANDFAAIAALDFGPIKKKLMHEQSGEGWSQAKADAVEIEYRRFLYLMKLYPREQTSPTDDVDTFWHYHILDTIKYADDCSRAFGYFLHHYPYVGMEGAADDARARRRCGERMRALYEATFGEPYPGAAAGDTPTIDPAYCGAAAGAGVSRGTGATGRAYCGAATAASYCGAATAASYCGAATAASYCGAATTAAYCGAALATAYCGAAAKPACSGATQPKTAHFGIAAPKQAYCGLPPSRPASSATTPLQLN